MNALRMLFIFVCGNLFCFCAKSIRSPLQVEIATLGIWQPVLGGALPFTGPAIDYAVEDMKKIYKGVLNITHTYIYDETFNSCFPAMTDNVERMASEFYYGRVGQADVLALIAPGCNDVELTNRLAKAWNILQITSAGGTGHGREDNSMVSPTWIAVSKGGAYDYISALAALFVHFKWTSVYLLFDAGSNLMYRSISNDVYKKLMEFQTYQLTFRTITSTKATSKDYLDMLIDFRRSCRIMVVFGHSDTLRAVIVKAYSLNMTNGEYIYFGIQQFHHEKSVGLFKWKNNDENDAAARSAYKSVLVLGLEYSDSEYADSVIQQVVQGWMNKSLAQYNVSVAEESPFTRPTYNSMMMFATVLNETFTTNTAFDFTDGRALAKLFLNRTFVSKMGITAISEYGDLVQNLTVRSLNSVTGNMDVVMIYDGRYHKFVTESPIDWPNGHGPPLNVPTCGYLGDAPTCQPARSSTIGLFIGISATVVVVVIASVLIGKFLQYRASLTDDWWYIDPAHILTTTQMFSRTIQIPQTKTVVNTDLFLGAGLYLGTSIWMKTLHHSPVDMLVLSAAKRPEISLAARQLLLDELKYCTHKNITRFVGLTYESSSNDGTTLIQQQQIFVLSEYCTRGSLQNLLKHGLPDWEISCSLMADLLKGIKFIHSSSVKFHGTFTGHKCLIDKFFTLKISDFCLTKLRSLTCSTHISDETILPHDRFFWTPPEVVLRETLPNQTSDIYAAAVILYQIITGSLPYDEDTIKDVLFRNWPKVTPLPTPTLLAVENQHIKKIGVIMDCWSELPTARPTVRELTTAVHKAIGKSWISYNSKSVAEILFLRFERYSRELEAQVHQRTTELLDEKQKCDRLLREILPREVISDLQKGLSVAPEEFESVSILFSSLAGFLEAVLLMSPMEISQLLCYLFDIVDVIVDAFRVYKVETVADSYMVASGLPVRIGQVHVKEICGLSSKMMNVTKSSSQLTTLNLKLKIGIHSGSCVAGIVGINQPRYCLFGDTINVASRMCVASQPGEIQISSSSADMLVKHFPDILLVARGNISVKGKGTMFTYWLVQEGRT